MSGVRGGGWAGASIEGDPNRRAALRQATRRGWLDYLGWVFAAVGTALVVAAIALAVHVVQFRAGALSADGVVVDRVPHVSTSTDYDSNSGVRRERTTVTYAITVEYTVDGHTYRHTPGSTSSSAPQVGTHVPVLYRPGDPADAIVDDGMKWFGALFCAGFGVAFGAAGWILTLVRLRGRRRAVRAVGTGRELIATVESVGPSRSSSGWTLIATVEQDGRVRRFEKHWDSTPKSTPAVGTTVSVYVDPDDPDSYQVADY